MNFYLSDKTIYELLNLNYQYSLIDAFSCLGEKRACILINHGSSSSQSSAYLNTKYNLLLISK